MKRFTAKSFTVATTVATLVGTLTFAGLAPAAQAADMTAAQGGRRDRGMDDGGPRMKAGMGKTSMKTKGNAKASKGSSKASMGSARASGGMTKASSRMAKAPAKSRNSMQQMSTTATMGATKAAGSCGTFMYWKNGKCNDARNPAPKPWKLF